MLKAATQAALLAKEQVRPNQSLGFVLTLTSSRIRSASQWRLYDPAERVADARMTAELPSELTLALVAELVKQSEIDFGTLRRHIRHALERAAQVSVRGLLDTYPAEQGLGSVVGLRGPRRAPWRAGHRHRSRCLDGR